MMNLKTLAVCISVAGLTACGSDDGSSASGDPLLNSRDNPWYINSARSVQQAQLNSEAINTLRGAAKNIILFVGDGMGASTVTAARIRDGQLKGMLGEENNLSFDTFPFVGLAKTYNVDAQTPDSAGTMTAMMSGVKTDKGVIGLDEGANYAECDSAQGKELVTALELAEMAGLSTGVISTARITHATPAAAYAKSANRNWEDDSDMSGVSGGCVDIASQLVNFEGNLEARYPGLDVNGIEVVMGGGRRHFLPKDAQYNVEKDAANGAEGDRGDGQDLLSLWRTHYPQGRLVHDQSAFDAIDVNSNQPVFGLFNESHMLYEADRGNDILGEPSLTQMTTKAINILDNNEKGFFLTVESGRIDHAHHAGNAYNALGETIELAKAVQAAMDATNPEETLIIVTADHSHVFTIAGYPKRGNDILGKLVSVGETEPALAKDDLPYTTLGYTNGRGFKDLGAETNADAAYGAAIVSERADLSGINTAEAGFHQESHVPSSAETHAGEDVAIYASGPGAHLVSGTHEQNILFHIMERAADLTNKAERALANTP
ncbi:MAG: alkaline phosphatase [Bermanella sp.]